MKHWENNEALLAAITTSSTQSPEPINDHLLQQQVQALAENDWIFQSGQHSSQVNKSSCLWRT